MIKRCLIGAGWLAIALLAGCGNGGPTQEQAIALAAGYYDAVKAGKVDVAVQVMGGERSPEEWRDLLNRRLERNGPLQDYHLRRAETNTVLNGRMFVLEYRVIYGQTQATETMTIQQTLSDKKPKIVFLKDDKGTY